MKLQRKLQRATAPVGPQQAFRLPQVAMRVPYQPAEIATHAGIAS